MRQERRGLAIDTTACVYAGHGALAPRDMGIINGTWHTSLAFLTLMVMPVAIS